MTRDDTPGRVVEPFDKDGFIIKRLVEEVFDRKEEAYEMYCMMSGLHVQDVNTLCRLDDDDLRSALRSFYWLRPFTMQNPPMLIHPSAARLYQNTPGGRASAPSVGMRHRTVTQQRSAAA